MVRDFIRTVRVSTSIDCTNSTTPHDSSIAVTAKVRVFIGFVYIKKFRPLPPLPPLPPLLSRCCHCRCCQSKFAPPPLLLLPSRHHRCCYITRCRQSKPSQSKPSQSKFAATPPLPSCRRRHFRCRSPRIQFCSPTVFLLLSCHRHLCRLVTVTMPHQVCAAAVAPKVRVLLGLI